jgi:hypothetical protein
MVLLAARANRAAGATGESRRWHGRPTMLHDGQDMNRESTIEPSAPGRSRDAIVAGLAGGVAYLAAQALDRRLVNPRSDDLVLLGGLVTERAALWRPLGLVMHLLAAATFGVIFDRLVAPRLPGPYWLRAVVMAQVENTTLWPLMLLINRSHPAVRRGELANLTRPIFFAQEAWRHLALGAGIGLVLGARRPR